MLHLSCLSKLVLTRFLLYIISKFFALLSAMDELRISSIFYIGDSEPLPASRGSKSSILGGVKREKG